MSYLVQYRIVNDSDLTARITACAALERIPNPEAWVFTNRWAFSAEPGWVAAYASAIALHEQPVEPGSPHPPAPGANEAAITDGMILAAVQALHSPS